VQSKKKEAPGAKQTNVCKCMLKRVTCDNISKLVAFVLSELMEVDADASALSPMPVDAAAAEASAEGAVSKRMIMAPPEEKKQGIWLWWAGLYTFPITTQNK